MTNPKRVRNLAGYSCGFAAILLILASVGVLVTSFFGVEPNGSFHVKNGWVVIDISRGRVRASYSFLKTLTDAEIIAQMRPPKHNGELFPPPLTKEIRIRHLDTLRFSGIEPLEEQIRQESLRTRGWYGKKLFHYHNGGRSHVVPYLRYRNQIWYNYAGLVFPLWLVIPLIGIVPILAFRQPLRHRWRRRKGLCLNCGYKLTGNLSGVCPECGTAIGIHR